MSNINSYLKDNLASAFSNRLSVAPEIPEKKINNAVESFKFEGNINSIVALYDNTIRGNGSDGILFTGEKVIYRASFSDPISIPYSSINKVEYVVDVTTKGNGKEKKDEYVRIGYGESDNVKIASLMHCNYETLAEIMNVVINDFDEYQEQDQLKTIAQLSEELKTAYLKVIVNMTFADDGEVDEKEFSEILQLMTRLELNVETRHEVRSYIADAENLLPLEKLIDVIVIECPESQLKSVRISLVKDLISVYKSVKGNDLSCFDFFQTNKSLFGVSDEEVELAEMAIDNDRKMISEDYSDTAIEKSLKELAAKSAAVGVPLGAVYLSGSVVGLSAAGLTSGLATLGFGGALGLSSMATGIGVAVLIGVGAYKGIKHLTGANELDGNKRRELMLQEVIKQTQLTISMLMDDINHITVRLNEAVIDQSQQEIKIRKLAGMLNAYVKAGGVLAKQNVNVQDSVTKLKCPTVLDVEKLESITQEPTKKPAYDLIMAYYVETLVVLEKDGESIEKSQYRLSETASGHVLDELAAAFQAIGYFDASKVVMGTLNANVDKTKDRIKGMFS
ncbi:MAG: hypothetical protein GYB21_08960 [Oceanospirillales bacterium]|nr:hypothetical protein [Oceanospirillales bacterium]